MLIDYSSTSCPDDCSKCEHDGECSVSVEAETLQSYDTSKRVDATQTQESKELIRWFRWFLSNVRDRGDFRWEKMAEAADEIERLQAKVADLKEQMFGEAEVFVNFMNIDHPKALGERDRVIAEQIAEIERLKAIPMKYRRMAFNAQLQEENRRQAERIAYLESVVADQATLIEKFADRIAEVEEENIQRLETSCRQHIRILELESKKTGCINSN